MSVTVDVTNMGERAGSEVVQVYVRPPWSPVRRPDKELRGFRKVRLSPGETRTVEVELEGRAFAYWDPRVRGWVSDAGTYELLVGSSSAEIHASILVTLIAAPPVKPIIDDKSPLQDWLSDPGGRDAALRLMRDLTPILEASSATRWSSRTTSILTFTATSARCRSGTCSSSPLRLAAQIRTPQLRMMLARCGMGGGSPELRSPGLVKASLDGCHRCLSSRWGLSRPAGP